MISWIKNFGFFGFSFLYKRRKCENYMSIKNRIGAVLDRSVNYKLFSMKKTVSQHMNNLRSSEKRVTVENRFLGHGGGNELASLNFEFQMI